MTDTSSEHAPVTEPTGATLTLPVVDDPDAPMVLPPEVRKASRRAFLGTLSAVGIGVGLAFADSLTNPFTRKAAAANYEMWRDCHGYFNSSTTCVPSSAYYGADNCAGTWHKNVGQIFGRTLYTYTQNGTSCAGRNAWLWTFSSVRATKCSDGWLTRMNIDTGQVLFNSFSICRRTGLPSLL